jgi:S-DNA-T family DNA segregation ATPase FtsK/SpoIIIE
LLSRQVRGRSGSGHLPDGGQRAAQLEEALRSFGVDARVTGYTQGPTITRFEVQPGPGVKVSRIGALAQDLALGMRAVDVRVAPIPGKAAVGIEVPNSDVQAVPLRDVMETPDFQRAASPLTVCLGQDIAGKPVVASLESLLHVLVAGATGSGKSITINCMLMSILFKARPDQVKLVLIDPKRVELSQFEGTPHLMTPVVTDPRKAAATLRAVVKEMERRYGVFTEAGVRDIGRFNEVAPGRGEPPLPFVVVVIDELADLMLVARSDVEDAIQRLTQMARAAGIHLIVATQRPSVDVITGVIKANIPTRIALAVSSQVDSRTILDAAGAEKLIGRGDMLFRPVGTQKLLRAQGAYVSEAEVEAVLKYLREHGQPEYDEVVSRADADGSGEETEDGEGDALFVDALRVVVESRQASVSNLQRRLRVGFTRAGRLVDMMEQRGYVGPHQGSKSREVLLTLDQFHRLYGDHANPDG